VTAKCVEGSERGNLGFAATDLLVRGLECPSWVGSGRSDFRQISPIAFMLLRSWLPTMTWSWTVTRMWSPQD